MIAMLLHAKLGLQTIIDDYVTSKKIYNFSKWGINLTYATQQNPEGVAQSILIAEEFINGSNVAIALGDNIFHGNDLITLIRAADSNYEGGTVFAYPVRDPQNYGVVQFDNEGNILDIKQPILNSSFSIILLLSIVLI